MSDLKQQAEAFRVGLLAGYVESDEVIQWADSVIAASVPGPELIEVSLGGRKSADELARTLEAIPGEVSPTALTQTIIRQMAEALRRDPATGPAIARCLYQMCLDGFVPSSEAGAQMSRLGDAFDLAASGTWGTLREVHNELTEFLSEWAD